MADLRIGISGWRYPPWRGTFYPKGLAQKRELEFASRQLNSIELNGSFYSLQTPKSYRAWRDATPPGFMFSLKGPRFITHLKRLKGIEAPLANFFASGLLGLNEKLGPILWQFPPNMKFDAGLFAAFFEILPRTLDAAGRLAERHDDKVKGRAVVSPGGKGAVRHAIEFRHESFLCEAFVELLRAHNIALVVADTAKMFPYAEDVAADFMYLRLHGAEQLYASGYTDSALDEWAKRIRAWSGGAEPADAKLISARPAPRAPARDVFTYFDNDVKVHAPYDAMGLARRLGIESADGPALKRSGGATTAEPRTHWPGFSPRKGRAAAASRGKKKGPGPTAAVKTTSAKARAKNRPPAAKKAPRSSREARRRGT